MQTTTNDQQHEFLTLMHFRKNRSTAPFYLKTYKTEVLCVKDVMVIAWFVVQFKATSFCFPYPGKAHVSHSMCTYHDSREHTNSLTQIAETSTRSRGLSKTQNLKKQKESKMSWDTKLHSYSSFKLCFQSSGWKSKFPLQISAQF